LFWFFAVFFLNKPPQTEGFIWLYRFSWPKGDSSHYCSLTKNIHQNYNNIGVLSNLLFLLVCNWTAKFSKCRCTFSFLLLYFYNFFNINYFILKLFQFRPSVHYSEIKLISSLINSIVFFFFNLLLIYFEFLFIFLIHHSNILTSSITSLTSIIFSKYLYFY